MSVYEATCTLTLKLKMLLDALIRILPTSTQNERSFLHLEYLSRNKDQDCWIFLSRIPKINICREFGNTNLLLLLRGTCAYELNCKKRKYGHIEISWIFRCSRMRAAPCSLVKIRWYFAGLLPVAYFAYSSTLKIEAVRSSELSVNFYQTARCHIPEDDNVHSILLQHQRCPALIRELDTNKLVKYFDVRSKARGLSQGFQTE
jgi:hypothetical protein